MSGRMPIEQIKAIAQERIFDVLRALGINEEPRGASGYISMCNPVEKDRHPSFTIWTRGAAAGAWKDHRGHAQGDVFHLVAYVKGWYHLNNRGFDQSLRFIKDLFGLERMTEEQRRADAQRSLARRQKANKDAAEKEARDRGRAFALWMNADKLRGSIAETYLRSRGIDLDALPEGPRGGDRTPSIIRCIPRHPHTDPRTGVRTVWPCMIAGMVDRQGAIQAVHRTWLKPDGSGKAPLETPRLCWPFYAGCVIPVWKGESRMTIAEANACGLRETLVLCEGIETALSAVIGDPRHRVWAVVSLSNLGNVKLPDCIDGVIVHRENDWTKLAAVRAYDAAKARLEAQGRPVVEVPAYHGKDLNDTLRGD